MKDAITAPAKIIHIARSDAPRPRPRLSRMARVYIVCIIAMLLTLFGYGLGALIIAGFWAILGSLTRRYDK